MGSEVAKGHGFTRGAFSARGQLTQRGQLSDSYSCMMLTNFIVNPMLKERGVRSFFHCQSL